MFSRTVRLQVNKHSRCGVEYCQYHITIPKSIVELLGVLPQEELVVTHNDLTNTVSIFVAPHHVKDK